VPPGTRAAEPAAKVRPRFEPARLSRAMSPDNFLKELGPARRAADTSRPFNGGLSWPPRRASRATETTIQQSRNKWLQLGCEVVKSKIIFHVRIFH
jgi:hypothetical protein